MTRTQRGRALVRGGRGREPGPLESSGARTRRSGREDASGSTASGARDGPGLYEPGQAVRWKRSGGARWRYGHLGDDPVEADGGLRVYEDHNGAARTLRPGQVQRLVEGPRGGRRWEACEPTSVRAARPEPERSRRTGADATAPAPKGLAL